MKILVTGGAGFIGSHLVDKLTEEGHEVRVFDNLEPQVHGVEQKIPEYLNKNAEFVRGNVYNKEEVKKALEDIEVIFHQAAAVGVGQSMYQIEKYVKVNTIATAQLLDILVNDEHDVKKLIVASSMSVYGEGAYECDNCGVVYPKLRSIKQLRRRDWEMRCPNCRQIVKPLPTKEDKPTHPTSIYAITKRDQEEMCITIGRAYGIPTVALRYFNVYGTRQSLSNPYTGVVAIFLSRILNGNPLIIFEDGNQSRDFVHVSDVVQANILAMETSKADYEIFNIGTGRRLSILNVANILIQRLNPNLRLEVTGKFREGDIRHCYADISKAQKKLGYTPKIRFEDGISELIEWVKACRAVDLFEQAIKELKSKGLMK
jgi:dTDP-L-rhamnose 4-epimerase